MIITGLLTAVHSKNTAETLPEIHERLLKLDQLEGKIAQHRAKVDAGGVTVPQNVAFYTSEIDSLIDLVYATIGLAPSTETLSKLTSFAFLVQAMEHGGLERALGAALFNQAANGEVKIATYNGYATRKAREANALDQFLSQTSEALRQVFEQTVAGPHIAQIEEATLPS